MNPYVWITVHHPGTSEDMYGHPVFPCPAIVAVHDNLHAARDHAAAVAQQALTWEPDGDHWIAAAAHGAEWAVERWALNRPAVPVPVDPRAAVAVEQIGPTAP